MTRLHKLLLYTNLFFLQSYLIRFHIGPYPTNLQEILILLQLLIFLISFGLKPLLNLKHHRVLIIFWALTAISTLTLSLEPNLDFIRYLKFLFFASLLVFIFLETFKTISERKQAFKIAGYGAIAFGIFSLIYNFLGYNVAYDLRLLGPLDAAVYLAFYLAPFFIFFLLEKKFLPAILLGLLLLATRSAGAIGASFFVILIYFFPFQKKSFKILLALFSILILSLTFYTKVLPAFQTNYSSLNERGEIWQTSFQLLQEPKNLLLGLGFGQFQTQYATHVKDIIGREPLDYIVLQPHNIFLLFIFNFGILGLVFLILAILKTLKLKDVFSFILLYFLLHGLIDTPFFKNDLLFIFVLLLSLILNPKVPHKDRLL